MRLPSRKSVKSKRKREEAEKPAIEKRAKKPKKVATSSKSKVRSFKLFCLTSPS